jgi:hypothetical protein
VRFALKHLAPERPPRFRPKRQLRVGTNTQADNAAILMRTIRFLADCWKSQCV